MNNSQRRTYGKQVEKINRRLEDYYLPRVRAAILLKVSAVKAHLRNGGIDAAKRYLLSDIANPAMTKIIKQVYVAVGLRHAKRVNSELRKQEAKRLGFNVDWTDYILAYLEDNLFTKVTFNINNTTRDALLRAIEAGYEAGEQVDGIIRRLTDWPYARFQAARIIRTEINRAANVGSMAAGSTFEYEQSKEWIAAHDNRTRGNPMNGEKDHANHWSLDGTVVGENETFTDSRNGDELKFPGDPDASAASVVNCRCTVALVGKRDERGRLIPKKKPASRISVILPGAIPRRQIVTI